MLGPLTVLQYPSGRWGFVGSVPAELAFNFEDLRDVQCAQSSGFRIAASIAAREGRTFSTRAWDSEADALAEAARLGHTAKRVER